MPNHPDQIPTIPYASGLMKKHSFSHGLNGIHKRLDAASSGHLLKPTSAAMQRMKRHEAVANSAYLEHSDNCAVHTGDLQSMSGNEREKTGPASSAGCEMAAEVPKERSIRASTVKDVARLAGVSQATVSRVVSGACKVSRKTKTKVLSAVLSLQYNSNPHAAELGRANGGIARKRGVAHSTGLRLNKRRPARYSHPVKIGLRMLTIYQKFETRIGGLFGPASCLLNE
jgi:hypothetical protein